MPELPDITVYLQALEKRILGRRLERVQISTPFLLRTATPQLATVEDKRVVELQRIGKRVCIGIEGDLWLVLHLMIAGRLHWLEKGKAVKGKVLAVFAFDSGTLTLTEAGSQRRASLHVVDGRSGLGAVDPGGLEPLTADLRSFTAALQSANHTLKRALTDPRLLSGIGNAYSDEILWQARLSPLALTQRLTPEEIERLYRATRDSLLLWIDRLRIQTGNEFPEKVIAFRPDMAVHGKYRQPCPRCGAKIQRIRYASNETNYCPNCQTAGKLLADRALSRLLKEDWPSSPEELENLTLRPGSKMRL